MKRLFATVPWIFWNLIRNNCNIITELASTKFIKSELLNLQQTKYSYEQMAHILFSILLTLSTEFKCESFGVVERYIMPNCLNLCKEIICRLFVLRQWFIFTVATVYILRSVYTFFALLCYNDPGTRRHLIFGLFWPHSFLISASFRHATNCISFEKFGFVISTHNFSCSKLPWWLKGYFSCLSTTRPVNFRSFFGMISTSSRLYSIVSVDKTKKLDIIAAENCQVNMEIMEFIIEMNS